MLYDVCFYFLNMKLANSNFLARFESECNRVLPEKRKVSTFVVLVTKHKR
jgi:hypothetical protein